MRKILKTLALTLAALMLLGTLASCGFMGDDVNGGIKDYLNELIDGLYSDGESDTSKAEPDSDSQTESSGTDNGGESESDDNEKESETEPEDDRTYDVLCGVPTKTPSATLECGDGSIARKYKNATINDYNTIRGAYLRNGYTEHSVRDTANTKSVTFVGGDTYAVVFLRKGDSDLMLVTSETDGKNLPFNTSTNYTRVCETTFTQPYSPNAGGMCEIIRIADGRFIIFDSGNNNMEKYIYDALCELNGSPDNIRIAAWVFTHAHGDHYGGFKGDGGTYKGFATTYKDKVELEYVLYSPMGREQWDIMKEFKEAPNTSSSWNTIDNYFNGGFQYRVGHEFPEATLVPVHAGQQFKFADVTVEILYTYEHLYVDNTITATTYVNSNNSSLFCRVVSENGGGAIIAGDCETEGGKWVNHTYTTELQANIMQMTHHGMGTDSDLSIMKKSGATVFVWASGEDKYNNTDRSNLMIKQYAARFGENLLHGYGTMTRPLNHTGKPASGEELLKNGIAFLWNGIDVTQFDANGIVYKVTDKTDPYIAFNTDIDTTKYNAIVLTVSGMGKTETGNVYFTSGSVSPYYFEKGTKKTMGAQGTPYTGYSERKIIIYLGNAEDYTGKVTSLRIDLGASVGTTVSITSIQAFKI